MTDFRNNSGLKFADISSESWREYRFESGSTLRIDSPCRLHVSESGGHRVMSESGRCYYVAPGWLWIEWEPQDGAPHFVA